MLINSFLISNLLFRSGLNLKSSTIFSLT